jgi:putative restriction endonuclease
MILRYLEDFQRLNTNASNGKSRPYKAALLLAVIEGIEEGLILNRRVYITPELIAAFRKQLSTLGATGPYQSRHFSYPFYHLKSESFWRLKEKPDKKIVVTAANSIGGLRQLSEAVDYAQLDVNLWELLVNAKARSSLRTSLLGRYNLQVPE